MLAALEQHLGVVTTAAKAVGIRRETHYDWYHNDEEYKAAVDSMNEIVLDFAESMLHKNVREGDTASTIFLLKCKGKKRGYVERSEQVIEFAKPAISIQIGAEDIDYSESTEAPTAAATS